MDQNNICRCGHALYVITVLFVRRNMGICHVLLYVILLFFSGYGVGEGATASHHHVIEVKSLMPASVCSDTAEVSGPRRQTGKMKLTYRYGPCSPLNQENSNSPPNSYHLLLQDQARVLSINNAQISPTNNNMHLMGDYGDGTRLPLFGRSIGAGNFIVTVGFGTPKRDFTLIFDTGSGGTWIQCQPCSCYPQQDNPVFDPSSSSSYSNASCTPSTCPFSIRYGDKSYSNGHWIRDTLTLTPSDVFPNFIFGCGQNNSHNFGTAAGILGIGHDGDRLSLLSQTAQRFALIFCYCLPATESSTGYLLFGLEALKTCQSGNSTPLVTDPKNPSFYFVNLNSITLGNQRLKISSFRALLDSGTVISRLPSSVYSVLRSAFKQSMLQYPSAPPLPPLMDTCYNLEGYDNVTVPGMVLQFGSSRDVVLDLSGIVWRENDSQVCLAFAGNNDATDISIIGNHQQRSLNILYDIQEKKVEFNGRGC